MLSLPARCAAAVRHPELISSLGMHLVPCSPPSEALDAAPRSALLREAEPGTNWEGFWCRVTDAYFARCTSRDGSAHWYRIIDEVSDAGSNSLTAAASRVLPFRGNAMR